MLTEQKRKYAQMRAMGVTKRQACVGAGYSPKTAAQAATRLEKDPSVVFEIARLTSKDPEMVEGRSAAIEAGVSASAKEDEGGFNPVGPADDALAFMRLLMNDGNSDPRLRLDAAKALASFTVAKPAATGKKEQRQNEAEEEAQSDEFAPGAPPRLAASGGKPV